MRTLTLACALLALPLAVACDDKKEGGDTSSSSKAATSAPPAKSTAPTTASASASGSSSSAMPTKQTPAEMAKAAARKMVEHFNAHDATKVADLYAEDAVSHLEGAPAEQGRAAIKKGTEQLFEETKDAKITPGRTFVNGDTVVTELAYSGTRSGDIHGVKVDKKPVGLMVLTVLTVNDKGLIKDDHTYLDFVTDIGQLDSKLLPAGVTSRPITTTPPAGSEVFESKGGAAEVKLLEDAKKIYAAFDEHKVDAYAAFVTDNTEVEDYAAPSLLKGTKDLKDHFTAFSTAFPDMLAAPHAMFAVGDYVVVEATWAGTMKAALGPFKPTNKPVSFRSVDILQMKDGKIAKAWSFGNYGHLLTEIGAWKLPEPPAAPAASGSASAKPATAPPAPPATH